MAGHLIGLIGHVKLVDLKVRDVQFALGKLAERSSTRSVRLARMILIQASRNAVVDDLVVRNVGGPMYATDVRMEFKRITEKAGLGRDWRSCTGTSSGRLRVPLPSRWARCSRAKERQREARTDLRLPVRLPRP
jgi:hypothetical protein